MFLSLTWPFSDTVPMSMFSELAVSAHTYYFICTSVCTVGPLLVCVQ